MCFNGFQTTRRMPSPNPDIALYEVTYRSQTFAVKGLLAVPDCTGSLPGLLYLRGGIGRVGMVRVSRVIEFASRGFIVFAPYYRGNKGGEGREDFCGDDRYDAIDALDVLKGYGQVDEQQIHVFGFSRGGMMALWTAIYKKDVVRSVVVWGTVSDLSKTYEERVDLRRMLKRVIGGSVYKYPERYRWRTPVDDVGSIKAPVLIIHGALDQNVNVDQAFLLQDALKQNHVSHELWLYEHYTHHVPKERNRHIVTQLTDWMRRQ